MLFLFTYAAAAKSLQSCLTLCNPRDGSPPGSPCPWDSPGKNPGVGCHFLLQCMKVKSESEVAQSCPTLSDPMDCSSPGSVHGIFQARVLEWVAIAFSKSYMTSLQNIRPNNFLKYNWHVTVCQFQMYNIMIWYLSKLQNVHPISLVNICHCT